MRIAFDLDDTLIPTTRAFAGGSGQLWWPASLLFPEALRCGAAPLLRKLAEVHEVWIYTTSMRKPASIKTWLKLWGVPVTYVVNHDLHRSAVRGSLFNKFSKAPRLFGIDLLVDDLPGVQLECAEQGCESLILDPMDHAWTDKVYASLNALTRKS